MPEKFDTVLALRRLHQNIAVRQVGPYVPWGELGMPIHRPLKGSAFDPREIEVLSSAFEAALRELNLVDRSDPATELVAKRLIELCAAG